METSAHPPKSKFATGVNGIIPQFNRKSLRNGVFQMKYTDKPGLRINELATEYKFNLALMNSQAEGSKEKYKKLLKNIKKDAKKQIIKDMKVNDDHMELFGFSNADFSRAITFRRLITDFIISAAEKDEFFKDAIRQHAIEGHAVDYSFANDLKRKMKYLIDLEINPRNNESEFIRERRRQEIYEISVLINEELNLRNKEKSLRPNLCYFILYHEERTLSPVFIEKRNKSNLELIPRQTDYNVIISEDDESFKAKVYNLSKTNLIDLVHVYCNANNDFYKEDIELESKNKKMEANRKRYKKKRDFTAEETRGFVKLYKEDNLTNSQIAEIVGCSLRTVERYSKL